MKKCIKTEIPVLENSGQRHVDPVNDVQDRGVREDQGHGVLGKRLM